MRKGMYGKLTLLAVAGVMALSGCGNSGETLERQRRILRRKRRL